MGNYKGYTQKILTAAFSGTPRLALEQPTGDVHVEGWDKPEIEISISDERELFNVEIEGSQVTIRNLPPQAPDMRGFFESYRGDLGELGANLGRVAAKVEREVERKLRRFERGMKGVHIDLGRWAGGRDYTIRVPHNCDLSLRSSSGDLTVRRVNGTHYLQSSSGDLNLDGVEGTVVVSTASGDINATEMQGKLGARSASGDISVFKGSLTELSITTASGDLNLDLHAQPEREFQIKSVSGDVDVKLPRDVRLSIEVNTLSGDVNTSFRGAEAPPRRRGPGRSGTIELNGGGLHGAIHTVSGDISIYPNRKAESDYEDYSESQGTVDLSRASVQPDDTNKSERDLEAERKREAEMSILNSLQNGEINVEEAMRQLGEL